MKSIAIATTLLLTGFSGLQAAAAPLTEFLRLFDLDGNGVLNPEERQAAKKALEMNRAEFIAKWDTNKDGKLSLDEIRALRAAIIKHIIAMRHTKFLEFAGEDELMSLKEFSSLPIFAEKDPVGVAEVFQRLDHDKSGSLSFLEFNARFIHYRL